MSQSTWFCCADCGEPLISSQVIPGCEWHCIRCGWFAPLLGDAIAIDRPESEVAARHAELQDLFLATVRGLDTASAIKALDALEIRIGALPKGESEDAQ